MRTSIVFVIGLVLGSAISTTVAQENRLAGLDKVNHVGIYVDNIDEAKAFFTKTMGFREAFTVRDDKGQPILAYMQASKDTFVELQPAGPNRPAGISHFGVQVENIKATIATLRERGAKVDEPRVSSTQSLIANVAGPNGVRIELSELRPESLQHKAIEDWK